MTTPEEQPPPKAQSGQETKPDAKGGAGDAIALGIGCAVFIIMLVAVILVGLSGR